MSDQLHTQASLPLEHSPRYPHDGEAASAPESIWTLLKESFCWESNTEVVVQSVSTTSKRNIFGDVTQCSVVEA